MFYVGLLILVQMNLEESGSIQTDPGPLSNDFSRVNEVVQDSVVDRDQGPGDGTLLLQLVGLAGGLLEDPALSDEDDVATGKLLLQFTDEPEREEELSVKSRIVDRVVVSRLGRSHHDDNLTRKQVFCEVKIRIGC